MSVVIKQKGCFNRTIKFLKIEKNLNIDKILHYYGEKGCQALEVATPKRTGLTSKSWHYNIQRNKNNDVSLVWYNTNVQNGKNIALLIQYGFVTKTGYRVAPRDYINPALEPIYEQITQAVEGR